YTSLVCSSVTVTGSASAPPPSSISACTAAMAKHRWRKNRFMVASPSRPCSHVRHSTATGRQSTVQCGLGGRRLTAGGAPSDGCWPTGSGKREPRFMSSSRGRVAVVAVRNDLDALAPPEDVLLEQPR